MKPKTDKKLAQQWACDERTIRNWRKARAPLHDDKKLLVWLTTRQVLPPGTAQILAEHRTKAVQSVAAKPIGDAVAGEVGALQRLEQAEIAAHKQYESACKSGDETQIMATRDHWLLLAEQLRKSAAQVEASERITGETMPREEVIRLLSAISEAWGSGMWGCASELLLRLRNETIDKPELIRQALLASWKLSLARGLSAESGLPAWVFDALTSYRRLEEDRPEVRHYSELFAEFLKFNLGEQTQLLQKIKIENETRNEPPSDARYARELVALESVARRLPNHWLSESAKAELEKVIKALNMSPIQRVEFMGMAP